MIAYYVVHILLLLQSVSKQFNTLTGFLLVLNQCVSIM